MTATPQPDAGRSLLTMALFAYNLEQYIRQDVAGALAQTYTPLQIILSDDGSTDRTFIIMQETPIPALLLGKVPKPILKNRNDTPPWEIT